MVGIVISAATPAPALLATKLLPIPLPHPTTADPPTTNVSQARFRMRALHYNDRAVRQARENRCDHCIRRATLRPRAVGTCPRERRLHPAARTSTMKPRNLAL